MKNEHIPFELIDEIHHWVEKNISTNEEEYSHKREKRLAIIHQTINNLKELSCDTPKDLIDEKKPL